MSQNENYIPRHINSGMMLLLWEADTVIIAVTTFLIFAMLGSAFGTLLGILAAFLLCKGWVKLKEEGGAGLITRLIYWFLYSRLVIRSDKGNSEVKEYIG